MEWWGRQYIISRRQVEVIFIFCFQTASRPLLFSMTDSKSLDSDNPNKYFYFKRRVIQLRINYQTTNRSPHLTRLLLNTIPALLFLRRQHSKFTMQHEQVTEILLKPLYVFLFSFFLSLIF